jgi:hypothetical protein
MIVIDRGQSKRRREGHLAALAVCLLDPSGARRLGLIAATPVLQRWRPFAALPSSPQS